MANAANVNVEVTKNGTENPTSLLRRFTKRVQGAGILRRVRGRRYFSRSTSDFTKKKQTLKKNDNRAKYEDLVKQGKISDQPVHRGRRR